MKLSIKKVISISVLVIIIAFFAYYIYLHFGDFTALRIQNPWLIIILMVITLLSSTFNGMVTDNLVKPFGIKLKTKEWFGLSVVTTFYNMITPFRGGMIARAAYLKKKHKFSYTTFLAALAGTYVISFLIAAFFGLISLYFLYVQLGIFNPLVLVIFLAFFIPLLLVVLFSPRFPETKNNFINKFVSVLNGWNLISKNRKTIAIVSIIAILQLFMGALGNLVSYSIFGIHISFWQAVFISVFGTFSILVSITPSGLGIQEVVSVFAGLVIGITPAQALTIAILNRAVSMTVIFTLGPIFSYLLLKETNKNS